MNITKQQLKQLIKEVINENRYEEVGRDASRMLRGQMDPLSKQELEQLLPGERIADPMIPGTFSSPGVLIPLGTKDGYAYFKTEHGTWMKTQIQGM